MCVLVMINFFGYPFLLLIKLFFVKYRFTVCVIIDQLWFFLVFVVPIGSTSRRPNASQWYKFLIYCTKNLLQTITVCEFSHKSDANGLWNLLGTCEIWHIRSPTGLWQFFQLLLLVVHRSSETSTNQSDVIIRSDDRFLYLVVDSDS